MMEENLTPKRQIHYSKKESTRSITYRLPEKLVTELETESTQKGISQNVLVRQILEKYVKWDRFSNKIGMISVPKRIVESLGVELDGKYIDEIITLMFPVIKDTVLFIKGGYDLKRCIETLEDYMRSSGMNSDHRVEGDMHKFLIQHDLGLKWSIFTEHLLTQVFHNFLSDKELKFQTTDNTVILSVSLGSDFNEHDYHN
jgi:metal-responsive CopG/Arc/MetJ family transcriptional regulator